MKIMTLAAAAAIALAGLTAAPAMAQRDHEWRGDRHDRNMRHRANGWERGRHHGWNHRRQSCRWVWRHHHRERVCYWR